jgi:hypothetical protein
MDGPVLLSWPRCSTSSYRSRWLAVCQQRHSIVVAALGLSLIHNDKERLPVCHYLPQRVNRLMRFRDILTERVVIGDLIEQASRLIPETVRKFVKDRINEWSRRVTAERREKLGYDPWYDTAEERRRHTDRALAAPVKPFDPYDFEQANTDWSVTDQIGNEIDTLIPKEGASPVYAAMGAVSKALTSLVQDYVRQKFGDPIPLQAGKITVPVSDIKVQVWWKPMHDESYGGVFRSRAAHANGPETRLEIVINRQHWRSDLIDAVVDEITYEPHSYDDFAESIINTFAHEYAHLEQDIKGQKSYPFTYLSQRQPGGKMRRYSSGADTGGLAYLGRPAEIDAFATGAAAQVAERLMRGNRGIAAEEWNALLRDEIAGGLPWDEYWYYIRSINDQLPNEAPAKARVLTKIKRRFLRTYVNRLMAYQK